MKLMSTNFQSGAIKVVVSSRIDGRHFHYLAIPYKI